MLSVFVLNVARLIAGRPRARCNLGGPGSNTRRADETASPPLAGASLRANPLEMASTLRRSTLRRPEARIADSADHAAVSFLCNAP